MVRRLPSLNSLRAFEAAARLESLTLAAGELNVAQAAVSRHVRELETWLGTKLFHRTGRGVTLTDNGASLASELTGAFDRIAHAVDRFERPGQKKRIVVSSDVSFAALWLIPRLKSFLAAHPDIELVVDPEPSLVDYAKGEADIGIRYGMGNWKGVTAQKLFDARAAPVCTPRAWAASAVGHPSGLLSARLIREDVHDYWTEWLALAGVSSPGDIGGTQVRGEMAIAAAEAGNGFAIADDIQAGDALMAGRLVRPFDLRVGAAAYYLVHAEKVRLSKPVDAFRTWLLAERDLFAGYIARWEKSRRGEPRSRRKSPRRKGASPS
jgi:LysR family glycine cleavage system transcriptional activator